MSSQMAMTIPKKSIVAKSEGIHRYSELDALCGPRCEPITSLQPQGWLPFAQAPPLRAGQTISDVAQCD
jgi:hypothetical protein